jgi:hypothetical protein
MSLSTHFLIKNNLIVLLSVLCSCQLATQTSTTSQATEPIVQGLKGKVLYKEGTFLADGGIDNNGKVYGVSRKIFIYELTNLKSVDIGEGDFIKNVFTEKIDSVVSDKNGKFFIALEEGKYSLFVDENERIYSKLTDGNYFYPVQIHKDSTKEVTVEIDYKAIY